MGPAVVHQSTSHTSSSSSFYFTFSFVDDEQVLKDQQWDEDEDVLDAWDAEEEEEERPREKEKEPKAPSRTKSASEKPEGKASAGQKMVPTAATATEPTNETEAERRARLDKLVKERDLESAMELFGIGGQPKKSTTTGTAGANTTPSQQSAAAAVAASPPYSFETASPGSMAEFDQFSRLISRKLEGLEGHRYYPQFLEGLVNTLVGRREAPEIRKISGVLANMATLKAKQARASTTRGPSTGASTTATLKNTKPSKGSGRFDDCFAGYDDGDGFDD